MKTYAGVKEDATLNQYIGFLSVVAFADGLKAAGSHPTQARSSTPCSASGTGTPPGCSAAIRSGSPWTNGGSAPVPTTASGSRGYSGSTFHLVSGADPICGKILPGKTVAPVS